MTAADFTKLLSKLICDVEDAGLSREELVDVLEIMAEAIRDEDAAPSTHTRSPHLSQIQLAQRTQPDSPARHLGTKPLVEPEPAPVEVV